MTVPYLPLNRVTALYADEIHQAVSRVIDSGWYLKGEATRQFEQLYAQYIGTRYCVGCGNGLDALTLILRAYKELGTLHDGDEVIVPANTFIATILAVTENRLKPVLVEPDDSTLQIDDGQIEQAITKRTRAVLIVHLYGRCAYTDRIASICRNHQLLLIEDNAQAHGCRCRLGQPLAQYSSPQARPVTLARTGSLGHAAGHSFYPGKNLGALGDAGAVTTSDEQLAQAITALGNYGSRHKYVHDMEGRNSRIDELQATVLCVKLRHLDEANRRRREIAALYINKVENPLLRIPKSDRDCVWHVFPVFSAHRDCLQAFLRSHGVETQVHYPTPPHLQHCYSHWPHLQLPVTERLSAQELSLPCHPAMTQEEAYRVVSLLNSFTASAAR